MSCKNCGQEPEDAFCPACGRSRRDDDKFCPNCGHRFTDSPAPSADEQNALPCRAEERKEAPMLQESRFGSENAPSKTIQSFFRCAHRIPACALGLFSALLFAFFAAPVAQTRFPRIGLGSVYTMTEVPSLTGILIFMLIFASLGLAAAFTFILLSFRPFLQYKHIHIGTLRLRLSTAVSCICCLFPLVFFIAGCALCAMIAAEDDGAGILAAGACPVLLIIFSLLFAAVILSVPALKRLIGKKYPLLAEEEDALKLQYESERKNETAARENAAAFRESHTPVCTAETLQASTDEQISLQAAEPAAKKQKPARLPKPEGLAKTVNKYMHFKRHAVFAFVLPFLLAVNLLLVFYFVRSAALDYLAERAIFAAAVIFDALCCTVWLILANKRVRKWEPSQARKSPGITTVAVMEGICCLLSVIVAIILTQYELELIFALLPLIPFVYFLALLLVTVLRTAKYRAKLCVAFFGEKNPAEGKAPLISFDPFGKN